MPKFDRKRVHEIAGKFFLKSKSMGHGENRFPILYRTNRTAFFENYLEAIDAILERKKTNGKLGVAKGQLSGSTAARRHQVDRVVRHLEGTVVGVVDAEIGQDNKGRLMLE